MKSIMRMKSRNFAPAIKALVIVMTFAMVMSNIPVMTVMAANEKNEIAFIDSGLKDVELLKDVAGRGAEIVYLDGRQDGIEQIADTMANRHDIDVIHIISHGEPGKVFLGNKVLSDENLEKYDKQMKIVGKSLKKDGSILIYGCNVAKGKSGKALIDKLAQVTGANAAASTGNTGADSLGGDWVLEYAAGSIENQNVLNIPGYQGLLLEATFDYEANVSGFGTHTVTQTVNGETLKAVSESQDLISCNTSSDGMGGNEGSDSLSTGWITDVETSITFSLESGSKFDLTSINIGDWCYAYDSIIDEVMVITSDKGSITTAPIVSFSQTIDISTDPNSEYFRGITSFTITAEDGAMEWVCFDNITLTNIVPSDATVIDYEADVAGFGTQTVTQTVNSETLVAVSESQNLMSNNSLSSAGGNVGSDSLATDYGTDIETSITFSLESGKKFDLYSINFGDWAAVNEVMVITSGKGSITVGQITTTKQTFDVFADPDAVYFKGITGFTVTAQDGAMDGMSFDNITLVNIVNNDTTAPEVTSAGIPADKTYIAGENLDFTVNFTENVTVAGGAPYIPIMLSTGRTVNASYISGSGTKALLFRYTVQAGDEDTDGIEIAPSIDLNGAAIKDAAGNAAVLGLNGTGATAGVLVDGIVPTVLSVNVPIADTYIAGENLDFTLNFSESVTVDNGIPTIPVVLNTGGTINAGYVSGSGTNALLFRYTVKAGDEDKDGIEVVSPIALNGATMEDAAGNAAELNLSSAGVVAGVLVDAAAPEVISVGVPGDKIYIAGENLDFTVNFSESVTVAGGTPTIQVNLSTGGAVNASYIGGSGGSALVFRYTVQTGDEDKDGVQVLSPIALNGAAIKDGVANDAVLILNSIGATAGVLVDGIKPEVTSVSVPLADTYIVGENLDFTVNFSETVTVANGVPAIPVTLNTGGTVEASYVSGSGSSTLVFRYTVQTGHEDTDGIVMGSAIVLNGAAITDIAANDAVLTLNYIGSTAGVLVDGIPPAVLSVSVPSAATYTEGQNLDFTVNYSEAVTVAGAIPYIPISLNTGGTVNASYISGSGSSALVFRYTVQAGNEDKNGIEVVSPMALNGAAVKDAAGNAAALALSSIGTTAGVLVDAAAPEVTSVNVPAAATYIVGENLDFTVNFSEAVTVVNGTPVIPVILNTGGTVDASYISGSGSNALVFRYTVQAGNEDADGVAVGGAIALNGAAIKDGIANDAVLTLNNVGATAGVLVDGILPTVSSVSVPAGAAYIIGQSLDFTVNYSEAVTVAGGTPYIPVTLNTGGTVSASYISGSGTNTLVFRYTVKAGDEDTDGIEVGTEINDNGAVLEDTAGNAAILALNSIGSAGSVLVDGVSPTVLSVNVPSNATYIEGQNLDFTVSFSESVTVANGIPAIQVVLDTGGTVNASYLSGTGSNALVFRYTVQAGDEDKNGIEVVSLMTLNGAEVKDAAGNAAALALSSIGTTAGVLVDAAAPVVTSVNVPAAATYIVGENLDFTVNFSEDVTVANGIPAVPVTLNTGGTVNASYVSGSGSNALVFRYTVQAGNEDADGITMGAGISANGAAIKDSAGNTAVLALTNIGPAGAVLIDGIVPTVLSVDVPLGKMYMEGQNLDFTVNFSEKVIVAGEAPYIPVALNTGGTVNACYVSGSGTNALVFRYTVKAGDEDKDGIQIESPINLNGAVIKDAADNAAALVLNSIGTTAGILADGIKPTVLSVNGPLADAYIAGDNLNFTVNYSEAVTVTGGVPYIPITLSTGGTVNASYIDGSGTSALVFRYTVKPGDEDKDGIQAAASIDLNGGTIKDAAGNNAVLVLNNVGAADGVNIDTEQPAISTAVLAGNNTYIDITFTEGVYGAADGSTALTADKLELIFVKNGGVAANTVISSIKKNDNTVEGSASALTGGETTVRVFLTITGAPIGVETIEITPSSGSSIYDAAGNAMPAAQTTGGKTLSDAAVPAAGGAGTITTGTATTNTIDLSWTAGSDNLTIPANLQYKVVRSTSNNIRTLVEAVANGTVVQNWTANIIGIQVTGLAAGTTYYFNVIIMDEAGNMSVYTAASKATASQSSGGSQSDDEDNSSTSAAPAIPTTSETEAIVNGQVQSIGTMTTATVENQTVTTVTIDDKKIEKWINTEGSNAKVVVNVNNNSDVVVGVLNGQTVKNMEIKEAVLEIKTENQSYTIPASEINITDIAAQIGNQVALKDIKISVSIASPSQDSVRIIENTANKNSCKIVVKPVEFEISCTNGNKTVNVSKFNSYVERAVAIPDGVDPGKITTGVVINSDGTFSHVPTTIVIIDGRYYARINSLTNSTYSVIWNPKTFRDLENHWAKNDVNDMGSRLVVEGDEKGNFKPDGETTRGEFAAIVVKGLGLMRKGTGKDIYKDVKSTDWYYDAVYIAAQYGLINGTGNNIYEPNRKITREEAMAIIARAMNLVKMNNKISETEASRLFKDYKDNDKISSWAKESVAACVKKGIVTGSNNNIKARDNITRAEVVAIVRRLLQKSKLI